jgi:nitrate/nitrite transporter NarK
MGIVAFFGGNILFGLAYFAPTIIRSMGYSPVRTQLMSVPPFAATFVITVSIAVLSDRWGQRGYCLFLSGVVAIAGYILFLTSTDTSVLYGSIVLQTVGAFTGAPAATTWNVNNVQPYYKRSAAVGLVLTMANLGGIFSTWIFNDPPRFSKATKINLASSIGVCVLAVVNRVWLVLQNKRKERERAERQPLGSEEEEEAERRRLGDTHPDFIYTL